MNTEVIVEYKGEANDFLLNEIVTRLREDLKGLTSELRRRLINVTIELINNIISHSSNGMIIEFKISRQGNAIHVSALNLTSENNFDSACLRLKNIKEHANTKELIEKAIMDSAEKGSAHLGIIKIYKNTRGNLVITKMKKDNSLIFNSKCILHEDN